MRSSSQSYHQESQSKALSPCPSPAETARLPKTCRRWKGLKTTWEWVVWARWNELLSLLGKFFQAVGKIPIVWAYRANRVRINKNLGFVSATAHRAASVSRLLRPSSSPHHGGWFALCNLMTTVAAVGLFTAYRLDAEQCWRTATSDCHKELRCVPQIKDISSTCVNKPSVSCIEFHSYSTYRLQHQTSSLWSNFFPAWSASD